MNYGRWTAPLTDLKFPPTPFWKPFRLKRWHYISISNDKCFFAFALIQLGYISSFFAYFVDRASGEFFEFGEKCLGSYALKMAPNSVSGTSSFKSFRSKFEIKGVSDGLEIIFEFPLNKCEFKGELKIFQDEAMALLFPLKEMRPAYTHKEAGNKVLGQIKFGEKLFDLNKENTLGAFDWTKSLANRITRWNWASLTFSNENNSRLGLNLSSLVYDDDQGHSLENAIWIDGKVHFLRGVKFVIPENIYEGQWNIFNIDPQDKIKLHLNFKPLGFRKENINLLFIKSKFIQPFGLFDGYIKFQEKKIMLKNIFGVVEDHYSLW